MKCLMGQRLIVSLSATDAKMKKHMLWTSKDQKKNANQATAPTDR